MEKYISLVDKHKKLIYDAFDYIWANPETGYREWKTHTYLKNEFEKLGYTVQEAGNIPGFIVDVDTGKPGPVIGIFGEMDALINREHPECDKETGAVHSCGHCIQTAYLLGLAAALKEPGALDGLCGMIRLIAVPAEEGIELGFREQLVKDGVIKYTSGKIEFLRRGLLDGVDMSFMIHADTDPIHGGSMNGGSNGLLAKIITFEGRAAHAGGSPEKGINALYAANLALNAINALRETFVDQKHIRVHPIITKGGDAVNAIPDVVSLETYIRGADMDAILHENKKIDRALAASAAAMGAKVRIKDDPGAWPRWNDRVMIPVFKEAMDTVLDHVDCGPERWNTGCSDMGDMASLMPTIQGYIGGACGTEHGKDYKIYHVETACLDSAKVLFVALRLFLENNAEKALASINAYNPYFKTREEYFAFKDGLNREFDAVEYKDDGQVILKV